MSSTISRRQLARFLAEKIAAHPADRPKLMKMAAAYLLSHGQAERAEHLVLDIARELEGVDGTVLAAVTTAHELTASAQADIENFLKAEIGAKKVVIDTTIDPELLSGFVVKTPDYEYNTSAQYRLRQLKSLEV